MIISGTKFVLGLCLFIFTSCHQKQETPEFIQEIEKHRENYLQSFIQNDRSPITVSEMEHIHFFDPDSDFLFQAEYTISSGEKPFEMPTYSGVKKQFIKHGELLFKSRGKTYILTAYKNLQYVNLPIYKDVIFIPFKDLTNGEESYGGGRYLDLKLSDIKDGILTLDFNKAYNPWCAYSDGYNCPIPPSENHLDIAVNAGEKNYTGAKLKRND